MDFKPHLLDTLRKIGKLPVSKIEELMNVQEEFVEYQIAKTQGKDETIKNLKKDLAKRK